MHLCIVLASYESCLANIKERVERTGRNVPAKFVKDNFSMLSHACKVYVGKQSEICESVLLYDNNERQAELMATVSEGKGVEEAMALVEKYLGPDAQPKK